MILSLFILQLIASCQVKEGASSGGGLISDHIPASNRFTTSIPITKTYIENEIIKINVTYPFDIISDFTGGNPSLRITVGSTSRTATFDSQPEPRKLVFNYTVQSGELDLNGIDVNGMDLNGSILQFDKEGVITNCNVSTVTTKNFSGVRVDTVGPDITDFKLTNFPGLYNAGEKINFTMRFSENVFVTGVPKFTMDLATGGTVDVNYVGGTGTSLLSFVYTISSSVADPNQYDAITSPIILGTGTMKDAVGNNANLDFSSFIPGVIAYSGNVIINGQYPFVTNVFVPANGTYKANDDLDFVLEFDRPVNVTGEPYLAVLIGNNTREAQYISGDGTEQLTFRYTAVPGDVAPNGISVTGSIVRNAGNIVDSDNTSISYFTNGLNNSFTVPVTSGIILNAIQPQAMTVTRNSDITAATWGTAVDNVWIIGQILDITIGFNTRMFVTQTGGTPSIVLNIGSTQREALYVSGGNGQTSLLFRYTVQEGDLDTDGTISLGLIKLNNGVITDAENTNTLLTLPAGILNTRIDAVRPVINSVSLPAAGVYSQVTPLRANEMNFVVNWSEAVRYSTTASNILLDIGGTSVNAQYNSGNNTANITHRPGSLANLNDSDGITMSSPLTGAAIVRDQAGNAAQVLTFTPPDSSGILVDTTAPTITAITPITSDGTHKSGDTLDFQVTFSEAVTTTVSGGYPRIPIVIGSTTRYLIPTVSKTDNIHNFRYTIQSPDLDTDGITINGPLEVSTSGHIRDAGRNNLVTTLATRNYSEIKVDAVVPTVLGVTASAPGTYTNGDTLQISVRYSEDITVTETGGTPFIAVDFEHGTDHFTYASGSGTDTLVFSRTLNSDHMDMNGLPSSISTINLNGGLLQDAGQNNAPTTFTAQDLSSIYVTYEEVKLWVKQDFVNIAPPGGATVENYGAFSDEACGSGRCRSFDGDDRLRLRSALEARAVFIAFKAPSSLGNVDIFNSDIELRTPFLGSTFDLSTATATINLNGTTYGNNQTYHSIGISRNSSNVLQVRFQSPRSYNPNNWLINDDFQGAVGEIIALSSGTIDATKLERIRLYLEERF